MARSCAKRSGVNLWFAEGLTDFTLLGRFRGAARQPPRRMPSTDGVISTRKPTIARDIS